MNDKKHELAEHDYMQGMKYKELAEKYRVSINTIKSWKRRHNWDRKSVHTKKGKVCTQKKKRAPQNKDIQEESLQGDDLTDKQRLFCIHYVKTFNATQAAINAGYSPDSAHVRGSELVRNHKVASYIRALKGNMTDTLFIDAMDVLRKYAAIAFADITDYVSFGRRKEQAIGMYGPIYEGKGEDRKPVMQEVNYVDLKDAQSIDGTIVTEVKQGRDGISVKLADKMKALDKLDKYFDLLPDHYKNRVEKERLAIEGQQLHNEKLKIEIKDLSGESSNDAHGQNKNYEEALNAQAEDIFADEVDDDGEEI